MKIASFSLALLMNFTVFAATWYAASDGSSTNGTSALPWSVLYSVTNTNPHLQPGDTVLFKSGTFICTESDPANTYGYTNLLIFRTAGTTTAKITYRPETLWGFSFAGGLVIPIAASNIIVSNFRIFCPATTNRNVTNYAGYSLGINHFSEGSSIIHNLIENTGHPGIGSWSTTAGKDIAGNIIRFTGFNDYDLSTGTPAGSGMYLQHSAFSPEALIHGNISYYNYTTGMKAYGNDNINGFNFTQNICAENNAAGIFYHQDHVDSQGFLMTSNYIWKGNPGLQIGYQLGNNNPSNGVISANYVVDTNFPISLADDWRHVTSTNNVLVNPFSINVFSLGSFPDGGFNDTTHVMSNNAYYASASGNNFIIYNTNALTGKTLAQWQAYTTTDSNSVITFGVPASASVQVFRPSTDENFIHVSVFNWPTNASTSVDLSSYFSTGSRLSIYDAQNIPNAYTNFAYSGGSVPLDLTLTNRATMTGTFSQRSDTWTGFDPRFRAFVIYKTGEAYTANVGTLTIRR